MCINVWMSTCTCIHTHTHTHTHTHNAQCTHGSINVSTIKLQDFFALIFSNWDTIFPVQHWLLHGHQRLVTLISLKVYYDNHAVNRPLSHHSQTEDTGSLGIPYYSLAGIGSTFPDFSLSMGILWCECCIARNLVPFTLTGAWSLLPWQVLGPFYSDRHLVPFTMIDKLFLLPWQTHGSHYPDRHIVSHYPDRHLVPITLTETWFPLPWQKHGSHYPDRNMVPISLTETWFPLAWQTLGSH